MSKRGYYPGLSSLGSFGYPFNEVKTKIHTRVVELDPALVRNLGLNSFIAMKFSVVVVKRFSVGRSHNKSNVVELYGAGHKQRTEVFMPRWHSLKRFFLLSSLSLSQRMFTKMVRTVSEKTTTTTTSTAAGPVLRNVSEQPSKKLFRALDPPRASPSAGSPSPTGCVSRAVRCR